MSRNKIRVVGWYRIGNVSIRATTKAYSVRDALDTMNRAIADGHGELAMTHWRDESK